MTERHNRLGLLFFLIYSGVYAGFVLLSAFYPAWMGQPAWHGVNRAVVVGMLSSLGWILLSADTYRDVYGWDPAAALVPFSQPGIVTIPLAFATLIIVSLLTVRPVSSTKLL